MKRPLLNEEERLYVRLNTLYGQKLRVYLALCSFIRELGVKIKSSATH